MYRITLYWYYPALNEHTEFTFPPYKYKSEQEAFSDASDIASRMNNCLTHYTVTPA